MPVEYKAIPQFTLGIEDRTVTGIAAVHGNIDDGGDRSFPNLFGDGTVKGRKRAVFLWQHDSTCPPIATIDRIFEIAAADLPAAVKLYAPETTGGTAIQRTYLDTPRGNEVLAGLKAGAITEMSYAYDPIKYDFEEMETRTIRNLYHAEPYDFSDVNWGLNPATSATGAKGQPLHIEHDTALAAVRGYITRLQALQSLRAKEGRVLSDENRRRIQEAMDAMQAAMEALGGMMDMTAPKQQISHTQTREAYLAWQAVRQRVAQLGAPNL